MVRKPPLTPSGNVYSRPDTPTNPSSIEPCNNWETPSSKAKYPSSDTSPENYKKRDRRSSTPAPPSDTRSKSKCWPPAPSPPLDRPSMPPSIVSNEPGLTEPSTLFYFDKPFGMLVMTKQWSTQETSSTVNYRQEDDQHRQAQPVRILCLPTSTTYWHASTMHPCVTCTTNRSFRTEETTTGTASEVAVFTP